MFKKAQRSQINNMQISTSTKTSQISGDFIEKVVKLES